MRLRGVRGSRNIEDRRRGGGGGRAGGIGGLALVALLAVGWFTGIDVRPLLGIVGTQQVVSGGGGGGGSLSPQEEQAGEFVARVLSTTEAVWGDVFSEELGAAYDPPVVVLFSGVTQSPCGNASGATGPFYCPLDRKAYIDTAFFAEMANRMGAGGDFAAAYVVAHEIAHHVQNELGILEQANRYRAQAAQTDANAMSVRIELQADCLSGVWGARVQGLLEPGDIEEALNAAQKIGDDYLMRQAGRVPNPHSFTHGTSAQRQRWFARGFEEGRIAACDTFGTDAL